MSSRHGGVTGLKRERLLKSFKESKASRTTSVIHPRDDGFETSAVKKSRKDAFFSVLDKKSSQTSTKKLKYELLSNVSVEYENKHESKRQLMFVQILTPAAMTKLFRIAMVKPEMVKVIEVAIIYVVQMRQIVGKVSEDKLNSMLEQINVKTTPMVDNQNRSPSQVKSPRTDSHIIAKSPEHCSSSSHLLSTLKKGIETSSNQTVAGTNKNH